jgi:hypothetical protein
LRRALAAQCLQLGLGELDAGVLQSEIRQLTQQASFLVNELEFAGIFYRSRHGHNLENWAIFEPFPITAGSTGPVTVADPVFMEALRMHGLELQS